MSEKSFLPSANSQPGLTEKELAFIEKYRKEDVNHLLLQAHRFKDLDVKKAIGQIQSRQKAEKKLPEWSAHSHLIFPPALSVEQSSSEATARFKSSLVAGEKLMDITGGMGVDCFYMSKQFSRTIYFELQEQVAAAAAYNFDLLNAHQIQVHHANSLESIQAKHLKADWIFADPARRDHNQDKVVRLADCTPDVVANIDLLLEAAPHILIKTSPLLDIDLAVKELKNVKAVYVIGYDQECKELLFHVERNHTSTSYALKVRIIQAQGQVQEALDFDKNEEQTASIGFTYPLSYLYEPHAAVLKSGAFKILGERFGLQKLAPSSHLYTSQEHISDFPGRSFKVVGTCKPDASEILKITGQPKANLTLRNFPGKIQDLRKKWRLKEGGDFYLFATTLFDGKKIVIATQK